MTNTLTDLDQINAELMSQGARNPFGRDVEPNTTISGEIVAVVRRHRHNSQGQPLYWVNRKPMVTQSGDPVIDSALILETAERADADDEGLRMITLDRDMQRALAAGVRRGRAGGVAIGGRLDQVIYGAPAEAGGHGRVYELVTYIPPTS
ncbi:hypothetical protein [Nocardia brasiliensis]|uniref:hypothetical protein n=1 Tax=Nocardia brasiliensis TaxID=37326 RepID=UPI0024580694|nr:hypothetical protein [Nocardia brasiliensis]